MNPKALQLLGQLLVVAVILGIGVGCYYLADWLVPQHVSAVVIAVGVAIGTQFGNLATKFLGLFAK